MTTDTAVLAKLAAAVERQRIAQEASDYLKKLTVRRNLCWIAASLCFGTAGFLTVEVWAGSKHSLPPGLISWLGPGLTTFSILGGTAIQKVINKRLIIARIEGLEAKLRDEIRDHAPADAIELARIATLVQQVAAAQAKLSERLASVETLNERLDKLADLLTLSVTQSARKAYAAGAMDVLAYLDGQRRAVMDRPDAGDNDHPAGDSVDAELRGFLAARMYLDEPPGAEP